MSDHDRRCCPHLHERVAELEAIVNGNSPHNHFGEVLSADCPACRPVLLEAKVRQLEAENHTLQGECGHLQADVQELKADLATTRQRYNHHAGYRLLAEMARDNAEAIAARVMAERNALETALRGTHGLTAEVFALRQLLAEAQPAAGG